MLWDRATHALSLLAIDPEGLGGAIIRARSGPVRDAFLECLTVLPAPVCKMHPVMEDEAVFGGLDLTETLQAGRLVERAGLIRTAGTLVLTMAERCDPTRAARLVVSMDAGPEVPLLIALDEGVDDDETTPAAIGDRLAFQIKLDMMAQDIGLLPDPEELRSARNVLRDVEFPDEMMGQIAQLCLSLGIESARAPLLTLRAARANAALFHRKSVQPEDLEAAAIFVLSHRATQLPPPADPDAAPEQPEAKPDEAPHDLDTMGRLDDRVLDAVLANLPDGILDQIRSKGTLGKGSGAGAKRKGNRRGRPRPSRPGRLSGQNRLDLVGTLRAAAPWQRLRGAKHGQIKVTPSDFRIRHYEDRSDRLLIFAVDASGSAAIARLAEAKGAVELLLAEAYSRRDHVSLISFRGEGAQTLLPPTRSLVQTKKRLSALPGGGGTPLAAGLVEALRAATQAKGQGMSPCIVLLTDGRANIAMNGAADRKAAGEDATTLARHIRAHGVDAIVLDLGQRPTRDLSALASEMGGLYLPLPRADAQRVSSAVSTALGS